MADDTSAELHAAIKAGAAACEAGDEEALKRAWRRMQELRPPIESAGGAYLANPASPLPPPRDYVHELAAALVRAHDAGEDVGEHVEALRAALGL